MVLECMVGLTKSRPITIVMAAGVTIFIVAHLSLFNSANYEFAFQKHINDDKQGYNLRSPDNMSGNTQRSIAAVPPMHAQRNNVNGDDSIQTMLNLERMRREQTLQATMASIDRQLQALEDEQKRASAAMMDLWRAHADDAPATKQVGGETRNQ